MINDARSSLLALLSGAGIRAVETVPERITPPLTVLEPAQNWVEAGDTFGSFRIGFDATVIVPTASNALVSKALDDAVDEVLSAVAGAQGFYVASVGAPSILTVQNAEFLTATMAIIQITTL